jgi:hypothetical protein
MALSKLTLSADSELIRTAKRLARARKTSVSALFSEHIRDLTGKEALNLQDLGPLTRRGLGLARLPANQSKSDLITAALMDKHQPKR